jgi:hypothetical protein
MIDREDAQRLLRLAETKGIEPAWDAELERRMEEMKTGLPLFLTHLIMPAPRYRATAQQEPKTDLTPAE